MQRPLGLGQRKHVQLSNFGPDLRKLAFERSGFDHQRMSPLALGFDAELKARDSVGEAVP